MCSSTVKLARPSSPGVVVASRVASGLSSFVGKWWEESRFGQAGDARASVPVGAWS